MQFADAVMVCSEEGELQGQAVVLVNVPTKVLVVDLQYCVLNSYLASQG